MKSGHPAYAVHPGIQRMVKWVDTLEAKTGRSVEEWVRLGRTKGPQDLDGLRLWFKTEHQLGTNSAWWLADRAAGVTTGEEDTAAGYLRKAREYVDTMYQGGKAALRPLHDALIALGRSMGKDVKVCPCSTIIPLYRHHVFAQIKPSTRTRIDFGLALGETKGIGRLIETGGFAKKDRITHRIPITSMDDVDDEVKQWLKVAYDRDA